MPLSLRQIRRRIKSVEGTKKMTRAMEMVAAAKLRKLQDLLRRSDRYIQELARILSTLVREKPLSHPLLEKREEVHGTLVFLITSDTGLCGSYNTNVLDQAARYLENTGRAESVSFVSIGRNGAGYLKRQGRKIVKELSIPRPQELDQTVVELNQMIQDAFISKAADEIILIYTHVESLAVLKPRVSKLLPIVSKITDKKIEGQTVDYILEPDLGQILDVLLPEYLAAEIGQCVKHSLVAEQASRMMAMRQATDNAKKMIDALTLSRNKARQATITKELIEVVSGSRAQKK